MKKMLGITLSVIVFSCYTHQEFGELTSLIQEKKATLKPAISFKTGTLILATTAMTYHEYQKSQQGTRDLNIAIPFLPLLYAGLGACGMGFLVYHFIGHEMALIIESQKTLKNLEGDIKTWQNLLPQLQHNQKDLSTKLQSALKVLDTITPLVKKLSAQDPAACIDPRIDALQKQLSEVKNLVVQLSSLQETPAQQTAFNEKLQTLITSSSQLFGKK